ncbi:MAG TPA: NAD(+)/NADH kinase [Candidatus Dormibacteraeota bacterium]|nr:NAD(+)/NADH kinase [Candidatus Dormibacteraeota bacterium]
MTARRSIGFLLHPREVDGSPMVRRAIEIAEQHGFGTWTAMAHPEEDVLAHRADTALLVTLGGDGTFLFGARLAAPLGIPVLGVNRGQLGFLTDVDITQLHEAVDCFVEGRHRVQRRSLLELTVPRAGQGDFKALALNEVVVKASGVNLARLRVEADDELLGEFDADGVIVATATGSTGYALSAGGPPVDPRVRALVIVPLAPHAVITRAVVVPEAVTVYVTVLHGHVFAAADGHVDVALSEGTRITVEPGPELQVVQVTGSPSFLRRLREKVRFGTPLKESLEEGDGHRFREREADEVGGG